MLWNMDFFGEFDRMRRMMDNLFNEYERSTVSYPPVNVYDTKDNVEVWAEIPGVKKENISLTYNDGTLTIAGERESVEDNEKIAVRNERNFGKFEKNISIPVKIEQDKISASYEDGILKIVLPKAEEAKPKTISINA